MYFEYRDIFRYIYENWIKSKLKKSLKKKSDIQKNRDQNFYFFKILPNLKMTSNCFYNFVKLKKKKKIPPSFQISSNLYILFS